VVSKKNAVICVLNQPLNTFTKVPSMFLVEIDETHALPAIGLDLALKSRMFLKGVFRFFLV
jgi:hypothetical protein